MLGQQFINACVLVCCSRLRQNALNAWSTSTAHAPLALNSSITLSWHSRARAFRQIKGLSEVSVNGPKGTKCTSFPLPSLSGRAAITKHATPQEAASVLLHWDGPTDLDLTSLGTLGSVACRDLTAMSPPSKTLFRSTARFRYYPIRDDLVFCLSASDWYPELRPEPGRSGEWYKKNGR